MSSSSTAFGDPDEYEQAIQGAAHYRSVVTAPGEFKANLTRIDMHRLSMQRGNQSLPAVAHVELCRDGIVFLVDEHKAPMTLDGKPVSPGDIIYGPSGDEFHYRTGTHWHWAAMALRSEDIAAAGRVLVGYELHMRPTIQILRPQPELVTRLQRLHQVSADLCAITPDILAHPEVVKAIEQELVRAMIACLADPDLVERRQNLSQNLVIRRFEQVLKANGNEPLYMTDICMAVGVAGRTLRHCCQEHLGMSPHRYLWLRRMRLARRALTLADAKKRTVTEIANDYGFGELGRFAVAYRQLFGEAPSTTLRRPPDDHRSNKTGRRLVL